MGLTPKAHRGELAVTDRMDLGDPGDLTSLLEAIQAGDAHAERILFERVYHELKRIAHSRLRGEHLAPTLLQTTELVHEAFFRLVGDEPARWQSRGHFFGAAVEAMRRILIDYARRRKAQRRGGGALKTTLPEDHAGSEAPFEFLELNDALDRLAQLRPRAAKVVGYRYFLGMTVEETAETLQLSKRTVNLDWRFASSWLKRELTRAGGAGRERSDAP